MKPITSEKFVFSDEELEGIADISDRAYMHMRRCLMEMFHNDKLRAGEAYRIILRCMATTAFLFNHETQRVEAEKLNRRAEYYRRFEPSKPQIMWRMVPYDPDADMWTKH